MAATAKKPSFMTAKGTASYPYLQPGRPDTQFDSEGIYKVQLMVDADQAKPMLEQLRSIANDEFGKDAKSANMPFKVDEETKKVIFTVKSRWSPKFVDASGKFIPEAAVPAIFGGSTLKCAGKVSAYSVGGRSGLSLALNAVQIVDLAEQTGGVQFEAEEEGGFHFEAVNDNEPAANGQSYDF